MCPLCSKLSCTHKLLCIPTFVGEQQLKQLVGAGVIRDSLVAVMYNPTSVHTLIGYTEHVLGQIWLHCGCCTCFSTET